VANGIPDASAALQVAEVVDAFRVMFRTSVDVGVVRSKLSIGGKDRVDVSSLSIGELYSDFFWRTVGTVIGKSPRG
jgi:hypothetical protein